jgi:serine/threonine protein phosphatase PrpC
VEVSFVKGFLRKIRGAETETVAAVTEPLSQEVMFNSKDSEVILDPRQLIVGCGQSIGKQRDHNEDSLFTLTTNLTNLNGNLPIGLYIVADGMGGHLHGEVASSVAIRVMAQHIINRLYLPLFNSDLESPQEAIQDMMRDGMQDAHRAITKEVPGGGTTMTAALVVGNQVYIAHVGDSRAYIIESGGSVETVTRDHSLVKRLVELGQITQEEAAVHPQRNVLYRALGQGEPFEPDMSSTQLADSGYLLLCSDGLWGVVPDKEILQLVTSSSSPHLACQKLVKAANTAGGPDNITAILVHLPG